MQQNFVTRLLPATGSQDAGGLWSNPDRITADDGSEASFWEGAGSPAKNLKASAFPVPTLPPGAIVDGIALNIKQSTTYPPEITVQPVALNIAGSSTKTIVFNGLTGGPTDKWGKTTISQADLTNLIVSINATSIGGVGGSLYVDCVYLIIYWHIDITAAPADVPTRVDYKVYSNDGIYLGKLPDVTSKLAFSQDINSAGSSIEIACGKFIKNEITTEALLTESSLPIQTESSLDILADYNNQIILSGNSDDRALYKNGNRVKVWIYNYWYPNGKQIFSGQINRISLSYGGDYSVKLMVHSDGIDLDNYLLQPASSFSYTNDVIQNESNTTYDVLATIVGSGEKGPMYWHYLGQTFKTGSIQRIGAIILYGVGSPLILKLYSAVNGTLLGTANGTPGATAGQIPFYFTTPVTITPNTPYFFTVEVNLTGIPSNVSIGATLYRNTADVYADGIAYQSTDTSPAWLPSIGGDLYFITQSATFGNTTVTYTSKDPVSEMIAAALTDYNTRGGLITADTLTPTGLSLTYSFNSSTIFEVIKKAIELSPVGYYAYIDVGTAEIDVVQSSTTADFIVTRGRNISQLDLIMTIENIKNVLLFSGGDTGGGDNLLAAYNDTVSISKYGSRAGSKSDNRVTITDTADVIGDTYIEESADEQQETSITVLNSDMDITLLTPGKTIGFRNFGPLIDDLVLKISRREYNAESVRLTLGRLPVRMNDVVAGINLALKYQETQNNPSSPS
jgi:hypothetical protein